MEQEHKEREREREKERGEEGGRETQRQRETETDREVKCTQTLQRVHTVYMYMYCSSGIFTLKIFMRRMFVLNNFRSPL